MCKAVQKQRQGSERAHLQLLCRRTSALKPRVHVHSRPALLPRSCLMPSLVPTEMFAKLLSGSADLHWVKGYVKPCFCTAVAAGPPSTAPSALIVSGSGREHQEAADKSFQLTLKEKWKWKSDSKGCRNSVDPLMRNSLSFHGVFVPPVLCRVACVWRSALLWNVWANKMAYFTFWSISPKSISGGSVSTLNRVQSKKTRVFSTSFFFFFFFFLMLPLGKMWCHVSNARCIKGRAWCLQDKQLVLLWCPCSCPITALCEPVPFSVRHGEIKSDLHTVPAVWGLLTFFLREKMLVSRLPGSPIFSSVMEDKAVSCHQWHETLIRGITVLIRFKILCKQNIGTGFCLKQDCLAVSNTARPECLSAKFYIWKHLEVSIRNINIHLEIKS